MSVRLITLTIVGFLLGAFAAGGVGVRVIREVRSVDDATSLPVQNIARSDGYQVDPNETLISSVALVPTDASIGEDGFVIAYDLTSLAPSLGVEAPAGGPVLYPKVWIVEALGGEFEGTQSTPDDLAVSFPLLAGGTLDQIDTVKVVEAFIPVPFEKSLSLSLDVPVAAVADGVTVDLVGQSVQDDSTVIEVRVNIDGISARNVVVVGNGPGWHPGVVDGESVFLTRENRSDTDDADADQASFALLVSGTTWEAVEGEFPVKIGATGE